MTRLLLALILALSAFTARAADTPEEFGLELVPWSKKLGEHRYESPRDWEGTLKFFRDKFKGYKNIKWSREVSLPAVKYVHLDNTSPSSKWQGINIYVLPDGHVRYFLLAQPGAPAPPAR